MHGYDLILTLTGGLGGALVFGYITQRVRPVADRRLPAGRRAGRPEHARASRSMRAIAEQLAEIGVILLMFGVGLQFHLEELLAVRRRRDAGRASRRARWRPRSARCSRTSFGWSWPAGIVFGMALVGGQHRRAGARAVRPQRAAHAGRSHRRRLAGRRGPVHRGRAGAAAGAVRRREPARPSLWIGARR